MALSHWRAAVAGLVMAAVVAMGNTVMAAETRPEGVGPAPPAPTGIVINLPARTLYWYVDGTLNRSFPVGIGRVGDQTPTGAYKIQNKEVNPTWFPPWGGDAVPPGPANPLGTRWMAFNYSYGIHGNNAPTSIGGVVSAGCIRMHNADVEWLYKQVQVGTPVNVIYETAQVQTGWDGRQYLAMYPDVYGRGSQSAAKVLTAAGFGADVVALDGPGLYRLDAVALVNGHELPALMHKGRVFVAARALANRLGAEVAWEHETRTVYLDGQPVTTYLNVSTGYVDAEEAAAVLGVGYEWNSETNSVLLSGAPVYLSGHLLIGRGAELEG